MVEGVDMTKTRNSSILGYEYGLHRQKSGVVRALTAKHNPEEVVLHH